MAYKTDSVQTLRNGYIIMLTSGLYKVFLLMSHQAWQLSHTESLQSLGHLVTDAELRTAVKETHCMMKVRHMKTQNVMNIEHTIHCF
jgi:hypothetical protein